MLYEMLAGRPPFLGDDAVAVISQHINTLPVKPSWHNPEVGRDLDALVLRLLAKDPEERPESARAVAAELRRIREAGAAPAEEEVVEEGLQAPEAGRFIGRQREQEQLKAALARALSGEGSTVMLVGEPGIGKTRLAEEFAVYAKLRGAQVLAGRCYEGGVAVPYLPFVEAFRQYVRSRPDEELREELGAGAPEVATLVSEIRRRLPDLPQPAPLEGDAERIRLFESVASFVRSAAAANPLVLILDDLHWADKPTLLLLQFLARGIARERVLLVGGYRDVELERTHPLADIVAALRREQLYERVLLRGLSFEEVKHLLRARSGQEPPDGFVQRLLEETEGNPFFVGEVLNHLAEIGAIRREEGQWVGDVSLIEENIPEGVREVIGRRLSRLGEGANRMLSIASALPSGFSYDLLSRVGETDEEALLDALDEALRARLVVERKEADRGVYEFSHALTRQTLYGELSTPRRVRLHRQIGEALEEIHAASPEPHLGELAYHFFQAVQAGEAEKAISYSRRAAERALSLMAYEEAAAHCDRALQALDFGAAPEETERCELLLALGEAQYRSGDAQASQAAFRQAAEIAGRLGLSDQQARAALGFAGPFTTVGTVVEERVQLLQSALEALGGADCPLRARLLSRLASEFTFSEQHERSHAIGREAVEVARRVGDPATLARALGSLRLIISGPDDPEEKRAISEEAARLAEAARDPEAQLDSYWPLIIDLRLADDLEAADRAIERHRELANELRQPYHRWRSLLFAVSQAMHRGRFAEAEALTAEAFAIGRNVDPANALQSFLSQKFALHFWIGGLEEFEPAIRQSSREYSGAPAWRTMLVALYTAVGREEDARREFEHFAAEDFANLPRDGFWLAGMGMLSGACCFLRDSARAARLCELLAPYAGRLRASTIVASTPMHEALARLATLLSRYEDAERHFAAALGWAERSGSTWLRVVCPIYHAEMLAARAGAGDRERALAELNEALELAGELGMRPWVERALALKIELQGADSLDASRSIYAVVSSVQDSRPDMEPHAASDGTVTLMFSDMEGFTEMTVRLGDTAAHRLMQTHHGIVRKQTALHGGHEVELRGDGFLLAFASPREAVRCAAAIQAAFGDHSREHPEEPIRVRMGLHTGEAIQDADKFFGKTVIQAFRIADLAHGGEILVSSELRERVGDGGDLRFDAGREVELKGISGTHRIFALQWQRDS
jgi:predicted ATPase/class 3 adenylate cyclase